MKFNDFVRALEESQNIFEGSNVEWNGDAYEFTKALLKKWPLDELEDMVADHLSDLSKNDPVWKDPALKKVAAYKNWDSNLSDIKLSKNDCINILATLADSAGLGEADIRDLYEYDNYH